ncbi:hypothetical protein EGW08_013562, partial [Elysia chlorotica]
MDSHTNINGPTTEETRSQTKELGGDEKVDDCGTEDEPCENQMSLDDIEASMKQMIEEVKKKREHDMTAVEEVKKEIMAQAKRSCEMLEQHMTDMHAVKGKEMDDKWEELVKVLDRIKESQAEIDKTKLSMGMLC